MKQTDEIVDEVRAARDAYSARFNYDLKEICKDLKAKEQANGARLSSLEPARPELSATVTD
jgi:hypothetical protein